MQIMMMLSGNNKKLVRLENTNKNFRFYHVSVLLRVHFAFYLDNLFGTFIRRVAPKLRKLMQEDFQPDSAFLVKF